MNGLGLWRKFLNIQTLVPVHAAGVSLYPSPHSSMSDKENERQQTQAAAVPATVAVTDAAAASTAVEMPTSARTGRLSEKESRPERVFECVLNSKGFITTRVFLKGKFLGKVRTLQRLDGVEWPRNLTPFRNHRAALRAAMRCFARKPGSGMQARSWPRARWSKPRPNRRYQPFKMCLCARFMLITRALISTVYIRDQDP